MYNADSPEVVKFVAAFQRVKGFNYPITTTTRRKYILVERDHSSVFVIERSTGKVYNSGYKYGTRGSQAGNLHNLTQAYNVSERLAIAKGY
jgi:hypothetical protein